MRVDAPGTASDLLKNIRDSQSLSSRKFILTVNIDEACKDTQLLQKFYDWELETDYQLILVRGVVSESERFLESLGEPVEVEESR